MRLSHRISAKGRGGLEISVTFGFREDYWAMGWFGRASSKKWDGDSVLILGRGVRVRAGGKFPTTKTFLLI